MSNYHENKPAFTHAGDSPEKMPTALRTPQPSATAHLRNAQGRDPQSGVSLEKDSRSLGRETADVQK